MIVLSTYGNRTVEPSDILQLECMFHGLVLYYQYCLKGISPEFPETSPLWEERAHECRTIALRVSHILGMDIREAQEYLSPRGKPYVG